MNEKKFVYHRALNTQEAFRKFVQTAKASQYTLVAEGDICWAYIDSHFVIYIHHPDIHGKSLSNEAIRELLVKNELFTLEKLLKIESNMNFIFELKTGNGSMLEFLKEFKDILEKYNVNNLLIDSFSVRQLQAVKKVMPTVRTSLHTKLLFYKYVLETSFEKPYFHLHNLYNLDFIDHITISFTSTHVNLLNLTIDSAYKHLYKANKSLTLGSIKSLSALKKALDSQAIYIYLRSKEVLNGYTKCIKNKIND